MKRIVLLPSILLLCVLIFSSCSRDYFQVKSFKDKTSDHQSIAILPVEMVLSGLKPFDLSKEDIQKQEEAESKAFQISIHNELRKKRENTKKGPHITMQKPATTVKLIEEKMSVRESWDKSPEEMAELLGVDAVVKTRIEKKRYFSDLASYGIDVASKVIGLLAKNLPVFLAGQDLKKSNDIYGRYELLDGETGEILWSISQEKAANYKRPADEVIDGLNEQAVKSFPYKKKRK